MSERWFAALGWALTGVEVANEEPNRELQASAISSWLADAGWSSERVQQHRAQCQRDQVAWPHQVPDGWLGQGTAARFHALLTAVRAEMGVSGLRPTPRPAQRRWGEAERRLVAEVPPHHGNVG